MEFYHTSPEDNLKLSEFIVKENYEVINKPIGGLWVSWNIPGKQKTYWELWAEEEDFYGISTYKYKVILKKGAKILLLDDTNYYRLQEFILSKNFGGGLNLDYIKLSLYFDVIGINFYPKTFYDNTEINFYCWDVPSAVILNSNVIKNIIKITED